MKIFWKLALFFSFFIAVQAFADEVLIDNSACGRTYENIPGYYPNNVRFYYTVEANKTLLIDTQGYIKKGDKFSFGWLDGCTFIANDGFHTMKLTERWFGCDITCGNP